MTRLTVIKLVIAASGILAWGYGVIVNNETAQWLGLGILVVAALLRFARPGAARRGDPGG